MTVCACMGAMYGEPYCYCTMVSRGLSLNTEARNIEDERSKKQLAALFGPGGLWYRTPLPIIPLNANILKSRNQQEGYYGGRAWASTSDKELRNGYNVWKRDYVRHARYNDKEDSLRCRNAKSQ